MATTNVDTTTFQSAVLEATKPVVVDFWAEWCGPCKMIGPSLEEISNEHTAVDIVKVNLDENPEIAAQYGVRSIPTLIMFNGGEAVSVQVGAAPKSKLLDWIKKSATEASPDLAWDL